MKEKKPEITSVSVCEINEFAVCREKMGYDERIKIKMQFKCKVGAFYFIH